MFKNNPITSRYDRTIFLLKLACAFFSFSLLLINSRTVHAVNDMPDIMCEWIDEEDTEEFDPDWYEEFLSEEEETEESDLSLDELIAKYAAEGDVGEEEIEYDTVTEDTGDKSLLIAHTGMAGQAAQNSLYAFQLAGQAGYNGIETDVRMTRDGVLVCYHDETLADKTGASGSVESSTWDRLSGLYVRSKHGSQPIAKFEDYLDTCKAYGCNAVIDLKYSGNYKTMIKLIDAMVKERDMQYLAIYQCSIPKYLQYAKELDPYNRCWLLCGKKSAASSATYKTAAAMGCEGVNVPVADSSVPKAVHSYGMTCAFYQTDDDSAQKKLFDMGYDLVMENGR